MKKWLRCGAIGVACLLVLTVSTAALGIELASRKLERRVDVPIGSVTIPTDPAAAERGRYLYASRGCAGCHGPDGAGRVFIDDPSGLRLRSPNITSAEGSVVARYRAEDWTRAIRHGVKPDGRPVFIMPSEDYNRLTDADLGALIAHVQRLPAAVGGGMEAELPVFVRLAYGFGVLKDAAEKIDHELPPAVPVAEGVTAEHGAYVANTCIGCHGPGLSGGRIPGAPPSWPAAANLTPGAGSVMPRYPDPQVFVAMMRSGVRPDGSSITGEMPFESFRSMSDIDLQALYVFLRSTPPRPHGER